MGWLAGWDHRKSVPLSRASGAVTNYQMKLHVFKNDDYNIFDAGWKEYTDNGGTLYQYNSQHTQFPCVIKIGSTYFMYFATRTAGGHFDIGLATASSPTAPQANWTFQSLVVSKGAAGKWDQTYVIPTCVIYDGSTYYLFYEGSGNSGTYGSYAVGYATSSDGYTWTKQTVDVPLLYKGSSGSWDDDGTAGTPFVVKDGATYYLFYHGRHAGDPADSLKIGYATASSITGPYTKYGSNPVLSPGGAGTWDSNWVGARSIFKYGSTWVMIYEGSAQSGPWAARMGIATSSDLTTWTKRSANPIWSTDLINPNGPGMQGLFIENGDYYLYHSILPASGLTSIGLYQTQTPDYFDRVVLNGNCQDDFDDLRIAGSDGTTLLDYWIESYTSGIVAIVWIEFDSIGTGATTFYVYYGKADAAAASNGDNTFLFFDDFSGAFPGTKWSGDTARGSISGGILTFTGVAAQMKSIASNALASPSDVAVRTRANLGDADYTVIGLSKAPFDDANEVDLFHNSGFTNHSGWQTKKAGAGTIVSNASIGFGAYHIYDACRVLTGTDTLRFFLDGVQVGSDGVTNVPIVDVVPYVRTVNAVTVLVDWILARQYLLVEPSWGSWGAEEQPGWSKIAKLNGVLSANIAKFKGIAAASIAKINGVGVSA